MNDFFNDMREGQEYAMFSASMEVLQTINQHFKNGVDFELHSIKQKNKSHYLDDTLSELYKEKRKLSKKITEREQEINHNK